MEEKIRQIRETDLGNRIGYDFDNQDGPTWENLFTSYFLHECSAEWLAEQLDISLTEVERIGALWDDSFQERTPETSWKLAEAMATAMGCVDLMEEDRAAFNTLLGDIVIDL